MRHTLGCTFIFFSQWRDQNNCIHASITYTLAEALTGMICLLVSNIQTYRLDPRTAEVKGTFVSRARVKAPMTDLCCFLLQLNDWFRPITRKHLFLRLYFPELLNQQVTGVTVQILWFITKQLIFQALILLGTLGARIQTLYSGAPYSEVNPFRINLRYTKTSLCG